MPAFAGITIYESRLLRAFSTPAIADSIRTIGLSPCVLILSCPSNDHMSVHVNMPIHMVVVRDFHSKLEHGRNEL